MRLLHMAGKEGIGEMGEIVSGPWGHAVPVRRYGSEGFEPTGKCFFPEEYGYAFCRSGSGESLCLGFGGEITVGGQLCVLCTWPEGHPEKINGEVK